MKYDTRVAVRRLGAGSDAPGRSDYTLDCLLDGAVVYSMVFTGPGADRRASRASAQWQAQLGWAARVASGDGRWVS